MPREIAFVALINEKKKLQTLINNFFYETNRQFKLKIGTTMFSKLKFTTYLTHYNFHIDTKQKIKSIQIYFPL